MRQSPRVVRERTYIKGKGQKACTNNARGWVGTILLLLLLAKLLGMPSLQP